MQLTKVDWHRRMANLKQELKNLWQRGRSLRGCVGVGNGCGGGGGSDYPLDWH